MSAAILLPYAVSLLKRDGGVLPSLSKRDVYDNIAHGSLLGGSGNDPLDGAPPDVGPAMMTVLAMLLFAVLVGLTLINYTINLILTLTIVEDPPAVYLPLAADPTIDANNKRAASTKREFITSSVRGTITHLRSVGGTLAPWRGFVGYFFLVLITSLVRGFIFVLLSAALIPTEPASFLAAIVAPLVTARMNMVVTHIRITAPSSQTWYTRVRAVPWAAARPTLPALLLHSLSVAVAGELAVFGARPQFDAQTRASLAVANLAWCVLVALPVYVVLVRVQASTLPAEAETVVVFDRSFGVADEEGKMRWIDVAKGVVASGAGRRVVVVLMKTVGLYALASVALVGAWMAVAVSCGAKFGVGN